jgi:hypothetical protein
MPHCHWRWHVVMTCDMYLVVYKDGLFNEWSKRLVKLTKELLVKKTFVKKAMSKMALCSSWTWSQLGTFWPIFPIEKFMFSYRLIPNSLHLRNMGTMFFNLRHHYRFVYIRLYEASHDLNVKFEVWRLRWIFKVGAWQWERQCPTHA